LVRAVNKMKMF